MFCEMVVIKDLYSKVSYILFKIATRYAVFLFWEAYQRYLKITDIFKIEYKN